MARLSVPDVRIARVHSRDVVDRALAMSAEGLHPTEIGRRLGVPKSTVQHAYLLGCNLGDGHVSTGRRTAVLSIYCSDDWPGLRREVEEAVRAVMPARKVGLVARTSCHAVTSHSNHWWCLFPQHGAGMKHTRPIVLEPWQREVVERHPGRLLRGLFHSDGCRVTNWTQRRTRTGIRRHEYPRYLFSNKSEHILGICASALDLLDVPHRRGRWDMISVATRAGTAVLDEHVGPKH